MGIFKPNYAHSIAGQPMEQWQPLEEHLQNVAALAAGFASDFGSSDVARLLGDLHDAGKARTAFQAYLKRQNGLDDGDVDGSEHAHSGAGACWVAQNEKRPLGIWFAYPLAGHHAGLTDWDASRGAGEAALFARLDNDRHVLQEEVLRTWIAEREAAWKDFRFVKPWPDFAPRDVSFWIRMLYSCLTDADFLDTERFMNAAVAEQRAGYEALGALAARFFERLYDMREQASATAVNRLRNQILSACEDAGDLAPGLFSLTVPTGGGKTLSSTAFAFRHALAHGKRRLIYVIPYTSIIEQTADVLRKFLGNDAVLEHHSNFDPEKETQRSRLASENWDVPVVVTTAVQFFESLYACKSSRCRKLHNLCNSVVILDESQLLPPHLLLPIAEAIHQLSAHYGSSIVLSTATQTTLAELPPMKEDHVREIIPKGWNLYRELKRTEIELPALDGARKTWEEVARELTSFGQVLCVVNTRRDCRELFELMPGGAIHLSASMCGEHRSRVIQEIKRRLHAGEGVRVISTQLVEAGVDLDFPVVYRAYTGLPSIVQSAGRCNREGQAKRGRVVVFLPPKAAPPGSLRWYEDAFTNQRKGHQDLDLDCAEVFPEFFNYFYAEQHDMGSVFKAMLEQGVGAGQIQFREAAEQFNMIDATGSVAVIVRYGDDEEAISALRAAGPTRDVMRRLQRYTVNIPKRVFAQMLEAGAFEEIGAGLYVQGPASVYSEMFGIDFNWNGLSIEDGII